MTVPSIDTREGCIRCGPLSVEERVGSGLVSGVDTRAGSEGVGIFGWKLSRIRLDSMRRV
jgi:hypothetical protein